MSSYSGRVRVRLWLGVLSGIVGGFLLGLVMENMYYGLIIGIVFGVFLGSAWAKSGEKKEKHNG